MKRVPIFLLAILFTFAPLAAENVKSMPAPTGYVDDYAGVMSPDGKARVDRICHEIHAKTQAQIFVVTIQSLDGETVATFANDLFHQWKIGEKKTDRGILLLFAVADHKWRIEVGYGLEGILPDAEAGRIGRNMVPSLKAGDYDSAALSGTQAIATVIARDARVTLDPLPAATVIAPAPVGVPPATLGAVGGFIMVLIFGGIFLLIVLFWISRRTVRSRNYNTFDQPIAPEPVVYGAPPIFVPSTDNDLVSSPDPVSSFPDFGSSGTDTSSFGGDIFSGGGGGDSGGGGADGSW